MRNGFVIRGDVTVIFLNRRDGSRIETLVDTVDLDLLHSFEVAWNAIYDRKLRQFYVGGQLGARPARKFVLMHRLLLAAPPRIVVDHWNHDTLDNRRQNLRLVTGSQNQQNRRGCNRNNVSSGILGVTFHKPTGRWQAKFEFQGRRYFAGRFDTADEAAAAVAEEKERVMGLQPTASALGERRSSN